MSIVENFRGLHSIQKYSNTSGKSQELYKKYDEPTYLTFKLEFGSNSFYNNVSEFTSYDYMPHPLLQKPNGVSDEYLYSAYNYLENINEPKRAKMLLEFIDLLDIMQYDYQWYFQSVDGLDNLLTVDTKRGKRLPKDASIEIKCLDALDRRLYHLFNLYRKIAWDDTYQRWMLPDMMRFFNLTIYISEFRAFHKPYNMASSNYVENDNNTINLEKNNNKGLLKSVVSDVANAGSKFLADTFRTYSNNLDSYAPIILKLMDNIFPTHVINCEMCEFDINSFSSEQYKSMNVSDAQQTTFSFKVKIGKVEETMYCPIFGRDYSDSKLNGMQRINEEDDATSENVMRIIGNKANGNVFIPENKREHGSGAPYFQQTPIYDDPMTTSYTKSWIKNNLYLSNNTVINRMVNNLTTFGTSVIENKIDDTINKLKVAEIRPGLSINSIQASIASGDVLGTLGLLHNAMKKNYEASISKATTTEIDNIVDSAFNVLMSEYAKATVEPLELPLQNAAKKMLVDTAFYEKIKDYSKATDMLGDGEINSYATNASNLNLSSTQYSATNKQIDNKTESFNKVEVSKATSSIIFEGNPSK